eukprot:scaffold1130_cov127-Isochrysis_galbana.AAC.4
MGSARGERAIMALKLTGTDGSERATRVAASGWVMGAASNLVMMEKEGGDRVRECTLGTSCA